MVIDATGCWVTPGFIDVQINGGHGIDLTTEPGRADELGRLLPRYGVTSFVPTIITCGDEQRAAALKWWAGRDEATAATGAVPVGLHLEGPMLAALRRGAHPLDLLQQPNPAVIDGWSRASGVLIVTLAPELPGAARTDRRADRTGHRRVARTHRLHGGPVRRRGCRRGAVRHPSLQCDATVRPPGPRPDRRRPRRRLGGGRADLRRHPRRPGRRADGVAGAGSRSLQPRDRRRGRARIRPRCLAARVSGGHGRRRWGPHRERRARRQRPVARPGRAQPRRLRRLLRARRRAHGHRHPGPPARPHRSGSPGPRSPRRRDGARRPSSRSSPPSSEARWRGGRDHLDRGRRGQGRRRRRPPARHRAPRRGARAGDGDLAPRRLPLADRGAPGGEGLLRGLPCRPARRVRGPAA